MRVAIELPDDIAEAVLSLARDRGQDTDAVIVDLLRRALGQAATGEGELGERGGILTFRTGRPITDEAVRRLENDE